MLGDKADYVLRNRTTRSAHCQSPKSPIKTSNIMVAVRIKPAKRRLKHLVAKEIGDNSLILHDLKRGSRSSQYSFDLVFGENCT